MRDPVIQRIEASLQARGERPTGTTLRRVLTTCVSTPWAMLPEKLSEIQAFLELRLEGHMGDDEIRAAVEQRRRTRAPAPTGVAVIPIFGVISKRTGMLSEYSGGTSVEKLQADIRAALNDPSVAQIVFDVDSPGGSVEGVFELSEWIYSQRGVKPMKAVANDLMASAAYAIASAANEVVVTPSSLAGSIGVFAMHVDVSGMQRMAGIKTTLVKFGKYKAETDSSQPLSDEAREHLQERVDYYGEMFIAAVARNRGTTPDAVRDGYGEGLALPAAPAVEAGLADRIATMDQVLAELGVGPRTGALRAHADNPTTGATATVGGNQVNATVVLPESVTVAALVPIPLGKPEPEPAPKDNGATNDNPADAARGAPDDQADPPDTTSTAPGAKEHPMSDKDKAAQDGAGTAAVVRDEAELSRRADILALCGAHGAPATLAEEYTKSSKTVAEVGTDLILRKREGMEAFTGAPIEMKAKDAKRYSITRAILAAADDDWSKAGFEREVDEELRKNLPEFQSRASGRKASLLVPTRIRMVDGMEHPVGQLKTSSATAGQTLVFTEAGDFIDLLRNKMVLAQLGAQFLTGLQGNVSFPKQTGAGTFSWVGEDPNSDQSDSDATLGSVALNAKEGQSTTAYTRKLLAQAAIDVDALVSGDLARITGLGIELGAINGSGESNQPTGILNTDSIGDVALGTNGDVPTYADIVGLETDVADANADIGTMGYLTTAGMRGVLKTTAKFSNTGFPVWDGQEMNGYPAYVSNTVPKTLTKGASSTCHAIIFGVWSQLIVGYWGAFELIVDPYSKKKQGLIELTSHQIVGVAIRHPESFAAIQDALTTAYVS